MWGGKFSWALQLCAFTRCRLRGSHKSSHSELTIISAAFLDPVCSSSFERRFDRADTTLSGKSWLNTFQGRAIKTGQSLEIQSSSSHSLAVWTPRHRRGKPRRRRLFANGSSKALSLSDFLLAPQTSINPFVYASTSNGSLVSPPSAPSVLPARGFEPMVLRWWTSCRGLLGVGA